MRSFATFRLSPVVSFTASLHMRNELQRVAAANSSSLSEIVRLALLHYAHKAAPICVPDIYQPRHPAHPELAPTNISTAIKPDTLRREYEAHANQYRITMSELTLRCTYAYLCDQNT